MKFQIESPYKPTGDQPKAIEELYQGLLRGDAAQCLLGVTGSGKTFTMANVIERMQRPTLILSHNKTLTAQLYGEFKQFFPNNSVEYFVSYYDYYQPEAYIASSDTYIEKDLAINEEIDKLRLRATAALLSGRRDVIIVASVSCIYGLGNPEAYKNSIIRLTPGQRYSRNQFLYALVDALYSRTESELERGMFRVRGDTVDIHIPYNSEGYRIVFWGDEIEELKRFDLDSGQSLDSLEDMAIFPANLYVAPKERLQQILCDIQDELAQRCEKLESEQRHVEAKRLRERVEMDLEMIRQLGYCSGIENYSRYFDGRKEGMRPFCLIDYFPEDYLVIADESHVTMSQFRAMYAGDKARTSVLVEHGFRLPSALDNRPLSFSEFESVLGQRIFVSATPADYELMQCDGVVVEQIVRPTGLLDPPVEVRPSLNQIDDLIKEIREATKKDERILITTITKRMSEDLSDYLSRLNIRCRYIHSDIDTMERVEILRDLRLGLFDVLIGINLLREGLDLPEVALVAILDADKEGFLRNERSLTQTAGRAARNSNGRVILYADRVTPSMQKMMDETTRRRSIQIAYNEKYGITPTTVRKSKEEIIKQSSVLEGRVYQNIEEQERSAAEQFAAETKPEYLDKKGMDAYIKQLEKKMKQAAKDMDFLSAAQWRDELFRMKGIYKERFVS